MTSGVMEIWHCRVPPLTVTLVTMDNLTTDLTNWSALDLAEPTIGLEELLLTVADNASAAGNGSLAGGEGEPLPLACGEWEPAQHNLFQLSNIFFTAAFLVPRSFKQSVLLLRLLLCAGFLVSVVWSGVHVCTRDMFAWNILLTAVNFVHALILAFRFLPPPLTVELTELYTRMFKPLKVSRKHFKELTREASLMQLSSGESYATEDLTPADERLSILLKGKLRVTCDGMHLHYINPHQFIDSPEWEAGHETSDDLFQVTITAEEDSMYLCWPKLRMDRVLRHRPMLRTILSNLIGKDITQKLYSLNEQLGSVLQLNGGRAAAAAAGAGVDHWHRVSRSLSVDAVDVGARGHVRSQTWRRTHAHPHAHAGRRDSLEFADGDRSPSRGQPQYWVPVVASQFPATSPFVGAAQQPGGVGSTVAAAESAAGPSSPALIPVPVIVPTLPPPPAASRPARRPREVKFDESKL